MDFKAEFDALGENRYASDMTSVATLILCTHASIISLYYWLNFDPTRLLAAKIPGYDAKPTGAAAMAAAIGYMMHETLARMHPTVSLSEQIALEDQGRMSGENLATETFRTSDVTTEQLHQDAQDVRETFKDWWSLVRRVHHAYREPQTYWAFHR